MIRKILSNSNGYALLLTFGVIVIFTVLGLSLMTLTMSGTTKNDSREDNTQSLNLAEKGQDFLTNEIHTSLANFTKEGKSRDDFIEELERITDTTDPTFKYKCTFDSNGKLSDGMEITTKNNNDSSIACIKDVKPVYNEDRTPNELKKTLEIVSKGQVDNKEKFLTTFVEIGAENFPEQLKYAVTSKGNLHLNGAVQLTGDLRIGENLTSFDKAHIFNGQDYWVETSSPSIKSVSPRKNPRVVISNKSNFYLIKPKITSSSEIYKDIHKLSENVIQKTDNIENLFDKNVFDKEPTVIFTDNKIEEVNITSKESSYYYPRNSASDLYTKKNKLEIPENTYNNKQYLVHFTESCSRRCYSDYNPNPSDPFILTGKYSFNQLATSSDLSIEGNNTDIEIKDTLYVKGNLNIKGNVNLQGSMYVNGNLTINNATLKTNALIYVNGQVLIQNSTVNSLDYRNSSGENKKGTLVIFSKQGVKLSLISADQDLASKIYGYFYSANNIEIYGSGSNIEIHGGVYGSRVTLHAVRGKTAVNDDFYPSNTQKFGRGREVWYYLKRNQQSKVKLTVTDSEINDLNCSYPNQIGEKKCYEQFSRLQIHYNEDVISTYLGLNKKENLVYKLEPPKIKNRH